MKTHKYNIVYKEDIIKELAERTGKPIEFLDEMVTLHYEYLNHVVKTFDEPVMITIPYFGKLRMNYLMARAYYAYTKDESVLPSIDLLNKVIETEGYDFKNLTKPLILRQYMTLIGKSPRAKFKEFYKFVRLVEDNHNKWYREKFGKKK